MQSKKKSAKMPVKKGKKKARVGRQKQKPRVVKTIVNKIENEKKPSGSKTMLIAQEIKFARLLANNDKKVRDKVLKNLKKWLTLRSQSSFPFTETDFARLWKGLFYCMWMSDKPLVQEELAEVISKIVHCFNSLDTALLYTKCTLTSLATEWYGIDRFRVDKFEMLLRKIIRETFEICKKQSWDKQWVVGMATVIEDILVNCDCNLGFKMHVTNVYMEELAKIGDEKIPKSMVTEFVRPFVMYLVCVNDIRQNKHIIKNIFRYLIFQSDVGIEYSEKFNAWREAGFPCASIDELERIEVSDEEEEKEEDVEDQSNAEKKPLDPRAGRVDVEIPQIHFDPSEIAALLKENKFHKSSTSKTRKHITRLIKDFTKLTEGNMPFGIKSIRIPDTIRVDPDEAAEELVKVNEELLLDSSKNYRKRKKNGDITEMINDQYTTAESDSQDSVRDQKTPIIKKLNIHKKQKLSETDNNEKSKNKLQNSKTVKETNQVKKKNKKKMKRLNVTEPLQKKKLTKPLKKLIGAGLINAEENVANCAGNTRSKDSVNNKWDVDIISTPVDAKIPVEVLENKKSTLLENKKSTKGKAIPEKEADTSLLNSSIPWLTPVLTRLEEENNKTPTPNMTPQQTPKTDSAKKRIPTPNSTPQQTPKTDSAKKKVKIVLQRNMSQNTSEYIRQIRQSPAIPYDANRKPKVGVLKPSPLPSPVNPFYKRKIFSNN